MTRYKQVLVVDETPCLQNDFRKLHVTPYQMNLLIKLNKVVPCLNGEDLNKIYIKIILFIKFRRFTKRRMELLIAIMSMIDDQDIWTKFNEMKDELSKMRYKEFSYDHWKDNYLTLEERSYIEEHSKDHDDEYLYLLSDEEPVDIDEINEIGAKEELKSNKFQPKW